MRVYLLGMNPFRKKKQTGLGWDLLAGAAAGALGTYLMSPAMQLANKVQPKHDQESEKEASWDEGATVKIAKKATEPLGIEIPEEKKSLAGQIVHWSYGTSWGIGYALLSRVMKKRPLLSGLIFGSALWLFGDELAVPAMKAAPKARAFPPSTHAKALWSHVVYGLATDGALRVARRALA